MGSADDLLALEDQWVAQGIHEIPDHSNQTPIGAEYGWNGQPWCAEAQSVALRRTETPGFWTAAVSEIIAAAKRGDNGLRWLSRDAIIQRGDMPCFDFGGRGNPADFHVSCVRDPGTQARFATDGGNESDAMRTQWRDRTYVMGFARPAFAASGGSPPAPVASKPGDLVIDYAWSKPDPGAIRGAGFVGAVRYLSHDAGKDLTPSERDALHAAGLATAVVWETTATRATEGRTAGASDAAEANGQANALGVPLDRPIYYAVDTDADPAAVTPYFAGVRAGSARPVGVYGSHAVIEALFDAGLVSFGWQAESTGWRGSSTVAPRACLLQRTARTTPLGGDYDESVVLRADWGQWPLDANQEDEDLMPRTRQILFHRGTDGQLYSKRWIKESGWESGFENLGAPAGSLAEGTEIDSCSLQPLHCDVHVTGADGALYHRWTFDGGDHWADWEALGGKVTSGPSVCVN